LRLSEFEFEIKYIPGSANKDADCLSRAVASISPSEEHLRREQEADESFVKERQDEPSKFDIRQGTWYKASQDGWRMWIPKSYRKQIWDEFHTNLGHVGQAKVKELVSARYYWPKMREHIRLWSRECEECAKKKDFLPAPPTAPMVMVDYSRLEPMEKVAIDVVGPLPCANTGERYLLVFLDCFTKWTEAKAVPKLGARVLVEWFTESILPRFGVPRELVLDQGSDMASREFREFCEDMGITQTFTAPYHHQSNPVERVNRSLMNLLRMHVNEKQTDWPSHVPTVLFAYRATIHESIGKSPSELLMGYQLRFPLDLKIGFVHESATCLDELQKRMIHYRQEARIALKKSMEKRKEAYDKAKKVTSRELQVNELVFLRRHQYAQGTSKKLAPQWIGPFKVTQRVNDVNWRNRRGWRNLENRPCELIKTMYRP
jgi:Integrase core domain.